MIFLERDFDVLKEENRKLRKEIDIKTSDSDQMMKMLENFDQKVQNHQKKEEFLTKMANENNEKVQEAYLERDRALLQSQQRENRLEH